MNRKTRVTRVQFHADSNSVKKPTCGFWHPPVCLNYKSEKGCVHGDKCHFRHVEAEGKPNMKSKKKVVRKDQLPYWTSLYNWVVYLKMRIRQNLFHVDLECWDQNTPSKLSKGTWHQIKIRERNDPSRGIIQKCALHERGPCAPKFGESSHEETLHQERSGPQSSVGFGEKNIYKLKNSGQGYGFYSWWSTGYFDTYRFKESIQEHRCIWWAKKRTMLRKDGHSKKVKKKPNNSVDCKRWSAHRRGGASIRSWLESIRNSELLEETPVVLSLSKLCKGHGYPYEWVSG